MQKEFDGRRQPTFAFSRFCVMRVRVYVCWSCVLVSVGVLSCVVVVVVVVRV